VAITVGRGRGPVHSPYDTGLAGPQLRQGHTRAFNAIAVPPSFRLGNVRPRARSVARDSRNARGRTALRDGEKKADGLEAWTIAERTPALSEIRKDFRDSEELAGRLGIVIVAHGFPTRKCAGHVLRARAVAGDDSSATSPHRYGAAPRGAITV